MSGLGRLGADRKPSKDFSRKHAALAVAAAAIFIALAFLLFAALTYMFVLSPSDSGADALPSSTTASSTTSTSSTSSTSSTTSSTSSTTSSTSSTLVTTTTTQEPSCFDGVKNQGELGADCGGPCRPCKSDAELTAQCFVRNGVKLYLRDDNICIQCRAIRSFFGSFLYSMQVYDCEDAGEGGNCQDMLERADSLGKMRGYPMWETDGDMFPGASVEKMKNELACT